jgi:hypothetical protein
MTLKRSRVRGSCCSCADPKGSLLVQNTSLTTLEFFPNLEHLGLSESLVEIEGKKYSFGVIGLEFRYVFPPHLEDNADLLDLPFSLQSVAFEATYGSLVTRNPAICYRHLPSWVFRLDSFLEYTTAAVRQRCVLLSNSSSALSPMKLRAPTLTVMMAASTAARRAARRA